MESKRLLFALFITMTIVHTQDMGMISGYIYDETSRESLIGANVYLNGTSMGTATDGDGYFVIQKVPADDYELIVSYLGFEQVKKQINLKADQSFTIDFELSPSVVELNSIEVSAEKLERKVNMQMSRTNLNVRQLKSVPQLGEADLFRTLQSLPGVLTENDFSTGLIIRGGKIRW